MIQTIFFTIILSVIIIIGSHYLYNYVKNTYSIKRNKCLVNFQTEKYKNMIAEMIEQQNNQTNEYLTNSEKNTMVENLETFLQEYTPIPQSTIN